MNIEYCIIIAVCSFVYTEILTESGMILDKLYRLIDRLPKWLSKPLGSCSYCLTGQLSLWLYLWFYIENYNILNHIAFICISIFITHILITVNYKVNE